MREAANAARRQTGRDTSKIDLPSALSALLRSRDGVSFIDTLEIALKRGRKGSHDRKSSFLHDALYRLSIKQFATSSLLAILAIIARLPTKHDAAVAIANALQIEDMLTFWRQIDAGSHSRYASLRYHRIYRIAKTALDHAADDQVTIKGRGRLPQITLRYGAWNTKLHQAICLQILYIMAKSMSQISIDKKTVDELDEDDDQRMQYVHISKSYCLAMTQNRSDLIPLLTSQYPLIKPPKRWSKMWDGGHYGELQKLSLIKNPRKTSASREYFCSFPLQPMLPALYRAVNILQETSWSINSKVFSVFEQVMDLAASADDPVPIYTQYGLLPRTNAQNQQEFLADRDVVGNIVYPVPRSQSGRRLTLRQQHRITYLHQLRHLVSDLMNDSAIYFAYQLDFRGRAYALGSGLQPQGEDLAKALLTFANGRPLGDHGERWLAIRGGTLHGRPSRIEPQDWTIDRRCAWTLANNEILRVWAAEPLKASLWGRGNPWQLLAFCSGTRISRMKCQFW